MASATKRVRVGGSKFTVFAWQGHVIARCQQVAHTSPAPVADSVAIQPLDARRPIQIITPNAIGMGTLVLEIIELYGRSVWQELSGLYEAMFRKNVGPDDTNISLSGNREAPNSQADAGTGGNHYYDLADIFNAIASTAQPITIEKYVTPPSGYNKGVGSAGTNSGEANSNDKSYTEIYHNCVISDFRDDETINIGTMQIYKQITVNYTHYTRTGGQDTKSGVHNLF